MRGKFSICLFLLMVAFFINAKATHIVGGEMTYRCLGNNVYQVRLDIYQDCLTGDPTAISQDNPAYITIYTGDGLLYPFPGGRTYDSIQSSGRVTVPPNFKNDCVKNPPATCLWRQTFIKNYTLPANATGYRIYYARCCRNGSIVNIVNPGAVGATYFCVIPPQAQAPCNNSAVFKNYPPQIICINNPLVYDHAATDADGDSLSYEFCEAYIGGSPNDAKPIPTPPADSVQYAPFFSSKKPMAGNPPIQIDPQTGLITGTPNLAGRYVVTVCCHEWRNGVMINTVKREFQFVVTNCSKAVVADIPQLSTDFNTYVVECKTNTVKFVNHSSGGFSYYWNFGVATDPADTSNAFEPTYTYPDTGIYYVTLVVNRGTTCPDSITRAVKIFPTYKADFTFDGVRCPGVPVQFTDLSEATYKPITEWSWSFGDGTTSNVQNPQHVYDTGHLYNVTLISKSIKGCTDTVSKQIDIEKFKPFAGNDTIIVKGESINFKASGGVIYTWTPSTFLNNGDIGNPTGYYPDTGRITYVVHIVSANNCEGYDTVNVQIVGQPSIFVPSAFTPNGDGLNDILRPIGIGFRNVNYFRVFNRWGQQVYFSSRFKIGWDGNNNGGHPADVGTYFWVLSLTDRFGKEQMVKGDVTLIR